MLLRLVASADILIESFAPASWIALALAMRSCAHAILRSSIAPSPATGRMARGHCAPGMI